MKRITVVFLIIVTIYLSSCSSDSPTPTQSPAQNTTPILLPSVTAESPSPSPSPTALPLEVLKAQIEEQHDIKVIYGENSLDASIFEYEALTDQTMIYKGLMLLNQQLERYPNGFFTWLRIDKTKPFHFVFASSINNALAEAGAVGVSTEADGFHIIILVINEEYWNGDWDNMFFPTGDPFIEYVLHHEIGHSVDFIIQRLTKGLPFDPAEWNLLLPPNYLYDDILRLRLDDPYADVATLEYVYGGDSDEAYFCDMYSKTNLEEHIASNFGYTMCDHPSQSLASPNIQAQLRYYFSIIRQAFGNDDWPDTTYWEKSLTK